MITPPRGVEEVVLHIDGDDGRIQLPLSLAADRDENAHILELRLYFSSWPQQRHAVRSPLLQPGADSTRTASSASTSVRSPPATSRRSSPHSSPTVTCASRAAPGTCTAETTSCAACTRASSPTAALSSSSSCGADADDGVANARSITTSLAWGATELAAPGRRRPLRARRAAASSRPRASTTTSRIRRSALRRGSRSALPDEPRVLLLWTEAEVAKVGDRVLDSRRAAERACRCRTGPATGRELDRAAHGVRRTASRVGVELQEVVERRLLERVLERVPLVLGLDRVQPPGEVRCHFAGVVGDHLQAGVAPHVPGEHEPGSRDRGLEGPAEARLRFQTWTPSRSGSATRIRAARGVQPDRAAELRCARTRSSPIAG